jgi:hypothetical protein
VIPPDPSMTNQNVFRNDVLFSLYAADKLKWPALGRTHLQRILYLCAVLSSLSDTDWGYEFSNTPFGPFNSEISKAPNDLVYQRYIDAVTVVVQRDSRMKASYQITGAGVQRVQTIGSLRLERQRLDWISSVMEILTVYGPAVTNKLAYLEPTLTRMKLENRKGTIDLSLEDNQSMQLLNRLKEELKRKYEVNLVTPVANLILFFDYLSNDLNRP